MNNLKELRIAIIGAGALGSELCGLLLTHGALHVTVIDPDLLQIHNIETSRFYQDLQRRAAQSLTGASKSELVVNEAKRHGLPWRAVQEEIADVGFEELRECDLFLSCPDNALARVEATFAARVLRKPLLDGGVMGDGIRSGRISWYSPDPHAACYLCNLSEHRRSEILTYALSPSLGCQLPLEVPSMTATYETLQQTAAEMLALLRNRPTGSISFARRISFAENDWQIETVALQRSATCPWHDMEQDHWHPLEWERAIHDSISLDEVRVQLAWPHCEESLCTMCGYRMHPHRRVAWVRRHAVCASCGSAGTSEPLTVVESVGRNDAASKFSPRQLGLPNRHLYLFRRSFVPALRKESNEPVA